MLTLVVQKSDALLIMNSNYTIFNGLSKNIVAYTLKLEMHKNCVAIMMRTPAVFRLSEH